MTAATWSEETEFARLRFEEGLLRRGFVERDGIWRGTVTANHLQCEIALRVPEGFPFRPARVWPDPLDVVPWSWHRELDGAMCLVAEDDHEDLWWADAQAFLSHVHAWIDAAVEGWPNDRADLDLERYFAASDDERLYVYDGLGQYGTGDIVFRAERNNVMRLQARSARPRKGSKPTKDRAGRVVSIGTLATPPRSWSDLTSASADIGSLEADIRAGRLTLLVVTYDRHGRDGAVVLEVGRDRDGGVGVAKLKSAPDIDSSRLARAGVHAALLGQRSVAMVGVGAVGSFTADLLVRSGVRQLTLIDGDLVVPGNLVRHLVGAESVGLSKVAAVRNYLNQRAVSGPLDIECHDKDLQSLPWATEVIATHDLVINATADFATTALLGVAANALRKHFVSVALQNDGRTARVDIMPPLNGAEPLKRSADLDAPRSDGYFEAGCGSPVSPTPPHAVVEAAAIAARHAAHLLVGTSHEASGEVRVLDTANSEEGAG